MNSFNCFNVTSGSPCCRNTCSADVAYPLGGNGKPRSAVLFRNPTVFRQGVLAEMAIRFSALAQARTGDDS